MTDTIESIAREITGHAWRVAWRSPQGYTGHGDGALDEETARAVAADYATTPEWAGWTHRAEPWPAEPCACGYCQRRRGGTPE